MRHRPLRGRVLLLLLGCVTPSWAQRLEPDLKRPTPFSRYAPASSNVFVTIRRLDELDRSLTRAHVWQFIPLLGATPSSDSSPPFDLRVFVRNYLGPGAVVDLDQLMKSEIGIASTSWTELAGAVWMARLANEQAADQWFPRERRIADGGTPTQFFTDAGVAVCVKGDIAAMSRRVGSESLTHHTVDLMNGRRSDSLEQLPIFQELTGYLPSKPLAAAYWTRGGPPPTADASFLRSPLEHAVVGMYEGDGRIDLAFRAAVSQPQASSRLSDAAIERMLDLPQTTLVALVTSIDFRAAFEAAMQSSSTATLGRYLTLAAAFRDSQDPDGPTPFRGAGPHVILTWGQDLSPGGSTPQIAALIECDDAEAFAEEVTDLLRGTLQLLQSLEPNRMKEPLPVVEESTRLGTRIRHVSLAAHAERSRLPFMRLIRHIEPCWAVSGRWMIFALTRDHLERILDAEHRLVPILREVPDVYRLEPAPAERTVLAVGQPGLAAGVLSRWLQEYEAGRPSLLDPSWWSRPAPLEKRTQGQLGVGMRAEQNPGVVAVARVYAGSAADGGLQVGDLIIGVDGQLLSLDSPNADLRQRIARSAAPAGPTLRVIRAGASLDVILRRPPEPRPPEVMRIKPADVVRELSGLARALDFASFTVLASDEMRYSARLSLRFAPISLP